MKLYGLLYLATFALALSFAILAFPLLLLVAFKELDVLGASIIGATVGVNVLLFNQVNLIGLVFVGLIHVGIIFWAVFNMEESRRKKVIRSEMQFVAKAPKALGAVAGIVVLVSIIAVVALPAVAQVFPLSRTQGAGMYPEMLLELPGLSTAAFMSVGLVWLGVAGIEAAVRGVALWACGDFVVRRWDVGISQVVFMAVRIIVAIASSALFVLQIYLVDSRVPVLPKGLFRIQGVEVAA